MRKFHEKSIVLGIGIGMIITAIAGMIFSAGTIQQPTKEEIIKMAKIYGLVDPSGLINNSAEASEEATVTPTATPAVTAAPTKNSSKTESSNERNITMVIEDGDKSQQVIDQLLQKGIITSEEAFIKVLDSYDASTKINYGNFKFKKNEDMDYIVKTICNIN